MSATETTAGRTGRDRRRALARTLGVALVAACVLAGGLALAACASSSANEVVIRDLQFIPATLTVNKGTTVTWKNEDETAHTVSSDTTGTGGFSSKPLNPGDSFTHTFDSAGTFPYHCEIHPYLKGTVIVR